MAGRNLKFTDYWSQKPVEKASEEEKYDEQYVRNVLTEQSKLNSKLGRLFVDQSENSNDRCEKLNKQNESKRNIRT